MKNRVTKIVWESRNSNSPARTSRRTGVLYLNLNVYPFLPEYHQAFVVMHEEGHLVKGSRKESVADKYAFDRYVKKGYPLSESVFALSKVLSMNNPEHYWRVYWQLERAKEYDYYERGNLRAYDGIN